MKISKRLGGDNSKGSINAVERGDFTRAIEIILGYYDKTYMFSLKRRHGKNIYYIETDTDDIKSNVQKIIDVAGRIY